MSLSRRRFFLRLIAAPAIVHIGNLMPVKAAPLIRTLEDDRLVFHIPTVVWRKYNQGGVPLRTWLPDYSQGVPLPHGL